MPKVLDRRFDCAPPWRIYRRNLSPARADSTFCLREAGEHFFVLATNGDGTTRLNHGERFSGALVVARATTKNGAAAYEAFSLALKRRVEQLRQTR